MMETLKESFPEHYAAAEAEFEAVYVPAIEVQEKQRQTSEVLQAICDERNRQDEKWGCDRDQHPHIWNTILTEEVGEVGRAILEWDFGNDDKGTVIEDIKKEAVQVAAVAVAFVEALNASRLGRHPHAD